MNMMNKNILLSSTLIILLTGCQTTLEEHDNTNSDLVNQEHPLIKFDKNKSGINSDSYELLDNAQLVLAHYKDVNIKLEGRASVEGEETYNQKLSEERVQSSLNYLKSNGISTDRVKTEAFGEVDQIPSTPEKEKERNRSVKVELIK